MSDGPHNCRKLDGLLSQHLKYQTHPEPRKNEGAPLERSMSSVTLTVGCSDVTIIIALPITLKMAMDASPKSVIGEKTRFFFERRFPIYDLLYFVTRIVYI